MSTDSISGFYQELIDSDEFRNVSGGKYAERAGRLGDRFVKVLSDSEPFLTRLLSKTDPDEPGFSVDERRERIEMFSEDQEDFLYNAPEIISSRNNIVEMEYLAGAVDLAEFALIESPEKVSNVSEEVGEAVRDMHEGGWAFRDFNLGNIMVEEGFEGDYEVYFVDAELAKKNPTKLDKLFGLTVFSYTYGSLPEEVSEPLRDGFRKGYGLDQYTAGTLSTIAAGKHLAIDRDPLSAYRTLDI